MKASILTMISFFLVSIAIAHPPKSVKLNYDKKEKSLIIDIAHGVKNPADHYISEIAITINDVLKETIKITKQSSAGSENYNYKIGDLKAGDKIKVKSTCNKFGSKSSELTIK